MGCRELQRSVAKARLKALGVENVNKHMGLGLSRAKLDEAMRCLGKKNRAKFLKEMRVRPLWRRVLFGDLAKDAERAQMGGKVRKRHV